MGICHTKNTVVSCLTQTIRISMIETMINKLQAPARITSATPFQPVAAAERTHQRLERTEVRSCVADMDVLTASGPEIEEFSASRAHSSCPFRNANAYHPHRYSATPHEKIDSLPIMKLMDVTSAAEHGLHGLVTGPTDMPTATLTALRGVLRAVPSGMLLVSMTGHILEANTLAEAMFDALPGQLVGRVVEDLLPQSSRAKHAAMREKYTRSDLTCRFMGAGRGTVGCRSDGTEFPLEVGLNPIANADGTPIAMLVTMADLSERLSVARLRKERDTAEMEAQQRKSMLATLSHEIRTPLMGVIGNVELLSTTDLDASQSGMLKSISRCADMVLSTISNVLDYSRLDSGVVILEKNLISINSLLKEVEQLMHLQLLAKGLAFKAHVDPDVPPIIVADKIRLRQVLINLTSNAVKFTETGCISVHVSKAASSTRQDASSITCQFQVQDTGVGMAPEVLTRIFKPFAQGDASTTRLHGGTGLGLVISKMIVELMGGQLSVQSEKSKGSTFTFTAQVQASKLSINSITASSSGGEGDAHSMSPMLSVIRKVLVVEDDAVSRAVIQRLLTKLGYTVTIACDGLEAVNLAKETAFDIIFMDVEMPRMSGYQATAALRDFSATARLPIIAMTANAMAGDRERCISRGMTDYIAKPFRLRDVKSLLDRYSISVTPAPLTAEDPVDSTAGNVFGECSIPSPVLSDMIQ